MALLQCTCSDAILNLLTDFRSQANVKLPPEMVLALWNNDPPTSQAIQTALALRIEPAEKVTRIDAQAAALAQQIASLEAQLQDLKVSQDALEKEAAPHRTMIRACDAVTSPIRRLPLELLSEITRHAMPTYPKPCKDQAPLLLCAVSSAWRSAILSSTDLWSTLYIPLKRSSQLWYFADTTCWWCQRAKERPLTLYLDFATVHDEGAVRCLPSYLPDLSRVMSKVRHLGLGGIDKVLPYLVHAPWTLDRLESLYLIGSGRDEDDRKDILTFDFFNKAPNLQKVTITNGSVSTDDSRRILPWSKITSLILTELLYLEDWVQVVESCPQLRTADFTVINCREEELDGFRDRKRVHQCLEDLTFEPQFGSVSVFDILSIFNFPMLRCLDLRTKKNTDVCIAPNSSNALRNLASIRSLVVNEGWDSDIGAQVLAEFLQECSNLVDLSLISLSPRLLPLFEDMGLSFAAPHILPHLAVLNISFSQVISTPLADIDAFCEIVKLRLMSDIGSFGFQPLKKVFIHVPPSYRGRGVGAQERMKTAILTHSLSHESVTFTESWEVGSLGRPRESPYYLWYANARAW